MDADLPDLPPPPGPRAEQLARLRVEVASLPGWDDPDVLVAGRLRPLVGGLSPTDVAWALGRWRHPGPVWNGTQRALWQALVPLLHAMADHDTTLLADLPASHVTAVSISLSRRVVGALLADLDDAALLARTVDTVLFPSPRHLTLRQAADAARTLCPPQLQGPA